MNYAVFINLFLVTRARSQLGNSFMRRPGALADCKQKTSQSNILIIKATKYPPEVLERKPTQRLHYSLCSALVRYYIDFWDKTSLNTGKT